MSDDCAHENTTTDGSNGTEWCNDCGANSHGAEHRTSLREIPAPEQLVAARLLCAGIGPRPCPGIQHERPIPVVVAETEFVEIVDVANGNWSARSELARIWLLADGSVEDELPRDEEGDPVVHPSSMPEARGYGSPP